MGCALSITPYIPGRARHICFYGSKSEHFGSLQCIKVETTTACLDYAGAVLSLRGETYWSAFSLRNRSGSVPTSAFKLKGASPSAGINVVLLGAP